MEDVSLAHEIHEDEYDLSSEHIFIELIREYNLKSNYEVSGGLELDILQEQTVRAGQRIERVGKH